MIPKLTPAGEALADMPYENAIDELGVDWIKAYHKHTRQALEMLDRVQRNGPFCWLHTTDTESFPLQTHDEALDKQEIYGGEIRPLYALPTHPATENTVEGEK